MSKFLATAGSAIALAIGLAATPASAQLIGGGLGGGIGLPGGVIGGAGSVGVERVGRSVTTTGSATTTATRTVRAPAPKTVTATGSVASTVTAPAVNAAPVVRGAKTVAAVPVAVPQVTGVVAVPAIPDLAVRRAAIVRTGIAPIAYADVPVYIDRQYVLLQDELAGTGVIVEKRGDQIVLELPSDVNFAFDKYDIQPRFYRVLNAVSRTLSQYPATYVDVNGHTDAVGSFSYNQTLSEKRADAVADYLASRSVNSARMRVVGYGKTEPVASNATIQGRAANRRVEIILTPYAA